MINESVYGAKNDWIATSNTSSGAPTEQRFYIANFGTNTSYDVSTLKAGTDNSKISLNKPIDKSLSWCGLGNFSTYSNCEYYNNKSGDEFKMMNKDSRTITNFAMFTNPSTWTLSSPNPSNWYYADSTAQLYGSRARWSPESSDGETSTTSNFNLGLQPFTQLPIRNCVFVPMVRVRQRVDTVTSSEYNERTVYIWEYLNTNNAVNYTTHPYIIAVGIHGFGTVDGSTAAIGNPRSNRFAAQNMRIAVLDELTCATGEPFDTNVPSRVQKGCYQYYPFGRTYSTSSSNPDPKITIFGTLSANNEYLRLETNTSSTYYKSRGNIILPHPNGQFSDITSGSYVYKLYYIQYYDGLQEWIRRQIACFGLFFTDDENTALYGAFNDENMFLGTLKDGIGNGDYTSGEDNEKQPQWNWTSTNDSEYDPSNPPEIDPNTYGVDSSFNPVSLADGALKRYVLDDDGMELLNRYLWDVIDTRNPDELISNQTLTNFLTNNPLDCIVNIKRFPFADLGQGDTTNIRLGKVTVENTAAKPFSSDSVTLSCGSKFIPHYFKDWRSYACEFTLVLPFCGSISLPPEIVVGHWITVKYSIDYTTGTCTAWVLCQLDDGSEVVIDSASGNCSIDIPVSGVQTATLNSQIYNANENLKAQKFNDLIGGAKSAMSFTETIASGDKMAAMQSGLALGADIVNAVHNANVAEWNINNTIVPIKMIGASSGCNSFQHELVPRLIIYKPVTDNGVNYTLNENDYAHSVGYQCCEPNTLGNYSGYIECTNVDLSGFNATSTEKNMIIQSLSGGVFI